MAGRLDAQAAIKQVTPTEWRELYCRAPYPSTQQLAQRYGVTRVTVAFYLRAAGIEVRPRAVQNRIEVRLGRQPKPPSWKGIKRGPENGERLRVLNLSRRGKQLSKKHNERAHAKLRTRFQIPCAWCGVLTWVVPHHYAENPRRSCSGSHGALYRRHRERNGDEHPRPLILDRLRQLLVELKLSNGVPIANPSENQISGIAAQIGATMSEIHAWREERLVAGIRPIETRYV